MIKKSSSSKNSIVLFITLLFVYIVLFEFILPVNKILPKPSLLIESFLNIWRDYNLIYAFTVSTTVIYLMLILGLLIVYLIITWLMQLFVDYEDSILSLRLFKYLPAFFFAVIFNLWFEDSILGEFIFALLLVIFLLSKKLFEESKHVKKEYISIAHNLDITPKDIYKDIYWTSSLPKLIEHLKQIHYYLWVLILMYEFIGDSSGIGSVYRQALTYNDFTALFTLASLIALLIWLGDFLIQTIKNELIHWVAE